MNATLADEIARSRHALTAHDLSQILSISVVTVFRLVKRGVLPALHLGTSVRFCPSSVAKWLREHGG